MEAVSPAPQTTPAAHAKLTSAFTLTDNEAELPLSKEDYRVRLPNFEGPLDLLLHLIRKEQIDIYDIPIARICQSYMGHLDLMKRFDVNIAGDFMAMAASLILLKSQLLLPKEETEDEEDPRQPLVAQLLEYERFKKAAEQLNARQWLFRDYYPRPLAAVQKMIPQEVLNNAPIEPIDTFQLLVGLKTCLDRTERKPYEVTAPPPLSLRSKVEEIEGHLAQEEMIQFSTFIREEPGRPTRKRQIILAFLAILELARLKFIHILQHTNLGPIQIRRVRSIEELDTSMLDQY